jgi:hypoxanthine-DNA glycosylase
MNKKEPKKITHPFGPVYNAQSKILILGTMASPKSREYGFFYGHPQNSFWRVLASIFDVKTSASTSFESIEAKKIFLLENKIAVWDVLHSCEIIGADDSSIKNPVANDFSEILAGADIKNIFTTGKTATKLYTQYCYKDTQIPAVYLPSTSPANRKYYNFDKLCDEYKIIKDFL